MMTDADIREHVVGNVKRIARLEQVVMLLSAHLRGIVAVKPAEKPEWCAAHDGGNFDDVEQNGYAIAEWGYAERAEKVLTEVDELLKDSGQGN